MLFRPCRGCLLFLLIPGACTPGYFLNGPPGLTTLDSEAFIGLTSSGNRLSLTRMPYRALSLLVVSPRACALGMITPNIEALEGREASKARRLRNPFLRLKARGFNHPR